MKIITITLLINLAVSLNIYAQFWEKTNAPDSFRIYSLAVNSSGYIFAGTDTGYYDYRSTDNGDTWTNSGLRNLKTTGIVFKPGEILISTLDHHLGGGVFRSTDDGISWIPTTFTQAGSAIAINDSGDIFVGTIVIGVFRSTDNGVNWVQIIEGLTSTNINTLLINSSGDVFAGTVNGGIFKSTDNGNNWVQINQGLTNNQVLSLAINTSGDIFAGTSGGGVFRLTDNDTIWVQINEGITGEALYVYSLAISSNGYIFAGTDAGIYRSTDNGGNWDPYIQGLTNIYVHSLAINSSDIGFAGTDGGVFRSIIPLPVELSSFTLKQMTDKIQLNWVTKTEVNNYGFNVERRMNEGEWENIGFIEGHGNSNSPKEYSYSDKDLFAGGSKFQYRLKQIDTDGSFEYSDIVEVEVVPNQFELSQNYPNPFNPSTTIRFSLPQAMQIKINLYNMIGEQVATIAEGMYETGNHKVTFNASNLPSGAYIYRIESSEFVQVKKMILIK